MGWAIALHGGAGDIPRSLPLERRKPREAAIRHCLQIGVDALKAHQSPLDVVELVVYIKFDSLSLSLYLKLYVYVQSFSSYIFIFFLLFTFSLVQIHFENPWICFLCYEI